MRLKILPQQVALITKVQTENMEAYEHFQKGRQLYALLNRTSNELAIEQLRLAIQKDPQYVIAYGELSNCFIQRIQLYGYPESWIDSARVYAYKGLEFDKNCAECYKALGLMAHAHRGGTLKEAIGFYEKALSINPNYEIALRNSVEAYISAGNYKSALESIKKLENVKHFFYLTLGRLNTFLGNFKKARIYHEKVLELKKNKFNLLFTRVVFQKMKDIEGYQAISKNIFDLTGDSTYLKQLK